MRLAFRIPAPAPLLCLSLIACLAGTVHADTWPQQEDGAEAAGFTEGGIEQLDSAMREIVANQDVAGMVWMLGKDGKIATYEAAGLARLDDQTPMTKDSLFRIYSMSKPVTAVAMMMLWEDGLWDFDDPISKYIPQFSNLQVLSSYDGDGNVELEDLQRQPTMRELMANTAGFAYGLFGDDPANAAFRDQGVLASSDLNELVEKVAGIPLMAQPGVQWYYSIGMDLQGYIVEQLTGMSFGEYLRQQLFEPLDMMDTRFYVLPEDRERFAEVHYWDRENESLAQQPHRTDRAGYLDPDRLESGGGGLVSSAHDYARFIQMLVNEGELDGARILAPESVRIIRTNSLTGDEDMRYGIGGPGQPGQGWSVNMAVLYDPQAAGSPQGPGTYYWAGAAGTSFWIDPVNDIFWLSMIQAQGPRRPGAANMGEVARDLIYQSLEK
ncbi:MAG: serine hydrolase domain-containing protein [Pseudohongiella sp.]|uniref:serine hydrolase domain-containing protein n=1 Tax=Pseudohongiella sp. TaxID=1979412 RepID=UPI00349FE8F7